MLLVLSAYCLLCHVQYFISFLQHLGFNKMFGLLGIKDYVFGGIVVALLTCSGMLLWENSSLKKSNQDLNNKVVSFESVAKSSKEEAEDKKVEVIKEVEVIKWKTETKIKTIKEYIKDENQSDCQNAMSFARSYF